MMIITLYPVMVAELIACFGSLTRLLYFFAITATYNIAETLYQAYFTLGLLAYLLALLGYLPFLVSLLRMTWRDTESRRLIFYRSCLRMYWMVAAIDTWLIFNTLPETSEYCELTDFMPDEQMILDHYNIKGRISREILLILCQYRFTLSRCICFIFDHCQYVVLLYLTRTYWKQKHAERVKAEQAFVKKLLRKKVTAADWSKALYSTQYMTMMSGSSCPYRYAMLGAVLVDKEIASACDYPKLLSRLQKTTYEEKMLWALFESRINHRLI